MKCLLIPLVLTCAVSVAHAQLLPVPGRQNPDWKLQKAEAQPGAETTMPPPSATDRMPNGLQKSISSSGNHHYHWDGNRSLTYDWLSAPDMTAPRDTVNVRDTRNGTVYLYRRASRK